jgi:hypothetical protein
MLQAHLLPLSPLVVSLQEVSAAMRYLSPDCGALPAMRYSRAGHQGVDGTEMQR